MSMRSQWMSGPPLKLARIALDVLKCGQPPGEACADVVQKLIAHWPCITTEHQAATKTTIHKTRQAGSRNIGIMFCHRTGAHLPCSVQ